MTTKELFIISAIPGVGKTTLKHFAKHIESKKISIDMDFESIEEIFKELRESNKKIKVPAPSEFDLALKKGERTIEESDRANIKMMSILDKDFPENLKDIPNSPVILHYVGDRSSYQNKCVAVIGTREPTKHGEMMGKRLSEFYVEEDFTIVSGLAIGCDTVGHKAAVEKRKPTIAILAGGLQNIYPKQNRELAEEIVDNGGLLLSEYEYGLPSNKNFFVERDRLQSGISEGIIVIETGIKGGTRHTVKAAHDQGRLIGCLYTHVGPQFGLMSEEKFQGNVDIVKTQGGIKLDSKDSLINFKQLLEARFNQRSSINVRFIDPPNIDLIIQKSNDVTIIIETKVADTKEEDAKEEDKKVEDKRVEDANVDIDHPTPNSKETQNTKPSTQLKFFNDDNT